MSKKRLKQYHVVGISKYGVHYTYEIYKNNEPFLVPQKEKLKKEQAYKICKVLNGEL